MTSPENVGAVSVEVMADAKALAKSLRKEVEAAFKGLDLRKAIRDSIGKDPIKVPVKPEFDGDGLGDKKPKPAPESKTPRAPKAPKPEKAPVVVDLVFDAFRAQLRKQVASISAEVHAKVPVDGETAGLRTELGSQLAALSKQLKVRIPAEPEDRAKLQADLQAQLAEVSRRLRAHVGVDADTSAIPEQVKKTRVPKVPVEVDPLLSQFQQQIRRQVASLARQVNVGIPVTARTEGLRAELGAQLKAIQEQSRLAIPTEPGAKAEYEAKLRALVAEASSKVKANVKVDVDKKGIDTSAFSAVAGVFKSLIPDIGGVGRAVQGLASGVQGFAASAAAGGSQLASSIAAAAGPIGTVVALLASAGTAMLALSTAATLAVPALTAAAGAAAAIPAALSGIGALVGTLGIGLKGISDAFKPTAGAGGGGGSSAAQQARQIAAASRQVEAAKRGITAANRALEASERSLAAAERGVVAAARNLAAAEKQVTEAQDRARKAQDAIAKARKDAAEQISDLNRSLKSAKLGEKEAALGVQDALRALNEAKLTGNIPDIERAQLAYERAVLALEDAQDTTQDLQEETDAANKAGVEGSDQVQQALQDQADALAAVADAQQGVVDAQNGMLDAADSLASAQDGVASALDGVQSAVDGLASAQESLAASQEKTAGGAGALGKELTKLAPNAQKFVDAIKSLKPAFESLRLDVQNRLFKDLDKTVLGMWTAWQDQLHVTLGSFADTINTFLRDLGSAVSTPDFIRGIAAGAEGFRQLLADVGKAITDDLVPAFGVLSEAAAPFLETLGDELAGIVSEFSTWVQKGKESGALKTFFEKAGEALHDIFTTGKLVFAIVGDLFAIITGSQEGPGQKSALDTFNDALQKVHDFLSDPENQRQISAFITDIKDGLVAFAEVARQINILLGGLGEDGEKDGGSAGDKIGRAIVSGLLAGFVFAFKENLKFFFEWFSPFGPLIRGVKELLGIKSPSTVFASIGQDIVLGLIGGIGSLLGTLAAWARNIGSTVIRAASNAGSWLVNAGRNAVIGLGNGISSLLGWLRSAAGNIGATVINAVSGAWTWLVNTGKNVVIGLYNGIVSMGSWIVSRLTQWVHDHVPEPIRWALGISSPSKVAFGLGQNVGEGLALGIEDRGARVQAAAEEVANLAIPQVADATLGLGADMDAAITRSLQVADTRQLQADWKPGATGDPLLDALRELISFKFNGSPDAAFAS